MKIRNFFSLNIHYHEEYKEATHFFSKEKYRLSDEFFKRCLTGLNR